MSAQTRRRFLVVLGVAPAFGACALATTDYSGSFSDNNDPDRADGGSSGSTTHPSTHDAGTHTTTSGGPTDSGATTSPGGPDTGGTTTTPPPDSGGTTTTTTTSPPPDAGPTCTPLSHDLGATSAFPPNSWNQVGSGRSTVVVGHDAGGYYVVSAICTHAGCTNDPPDTSGGQYCSCHGASFDPDGKVTGGPARSNLKNYKVVVCGGRVTSDLATTVAAGTRAN